ncbi:MAG TPA: lysophospholipid acyltransferase family protein [Gammaproteobacteria bacterium]|nr:lysophospholipid acyltransferase family protein [Gammaproteobacteria bacterium]
MMPYLRSLLFLVGEVCSTLIFAPLSLLTYPLPFAMRYRFITQWTRFNLWWLEKTCRVRYRVRGREHIPGANAIIVCKHQSAWETLALTRIFPPQVWVIKRELLWVPFFGWGLAMLEPIAINRKAGRKAVRQLVEQGCRRLDQGRWVVVFPEGTRVAPGQKRRYALGGGILAQESGYPVVPVAHNAGEFWPRRGFLKRPGTIELVIGPPVETRGRTADQIIAAAEGWIETTMGEISTTGGARPIKTR